MKKDLLPIIAAYWGCKCSYTDPRPVELNWTELSHLEDEGMDDFKLHLRKPWDITEKELLEIGRIANADRPQVNIDTYGWDAKRSIKDGNYGDPILKINDENGITINSYYPVQIVNYLRHKGFCVDQELIDNDLVEWI